MKRTRCVVPIICLVVAFGAGRAFAAACAADTYDHYVGTTCTIGTLTFSLFSFANAATGGAILIPSSAITVTPITTPGEVGFQFSGPWAVGSSSSQDTALGYTVSAASAVITDFGLVFDGSATGGGAASAAEAGCLNHAVAGCPAGSLVPLSVTNLAPKQFALGLGPAQSIAVAEDINVSAASSSTATISQVINTFSQGCVKPIGPLTLAPGVLNAVYPSVTFTLTGGTPPVAFAESGPLPNGMGFNNGVLSGTPTQSGSFPITVSASDNSGCTGSQSYTLVIAPSVAATACTATTYDHYLGATCTINSLTFSNFGYTSSAAPTGSPIPASAISVTPVTTPGGEGFTFGGGWAATPLNGNSTALDSLLYYAVSAPAAAITGIELDFTTVVTGTGLTGVTEAYCLGAPIENCQFGTLNKLNVSPLSPKQSVLGLGPVQSVAVSKDITATSGADGTASITQVTNTFMHCALPLTPATLPTGTAGSPYPTVTFGLTGGATPITFTVIGALPLAMSPAGGQLSGTPLKTGSFPISVMGVDNAGCVGVTAYTLTIDCQAITVIPPAATSAIVGMPFSQDFTQTGAIGGATFAITSGTIPGLSLSSGGVLSGIPTTAGSFPITVTVTDGNGCTGSAPYTLTVVVPIPALGWSGLLGLAVLLALAAILLLRRGVVHG
jgi:hypothetical protein